MIVTLFRREPLESDWGDSNEWDRACTLYEHGVRSLSYATDYDLGHILRNLAAVVALAAAYEFGHEAGRRDGFRAGLRAGTGIYPGGG